MDLIRRYGRNRQTTVKPSYKLNFIICFQAMGLYLPTSTNQMVKYGQLFYGDPEHPDIVFYTDDIQERTATPEVSGYIRVCSRRATPAKERDWSKLLVGIL